MSNNYINKYPWRALGLFMLGLVCLFAILQVWRYSAKPDISRKDEIIENSLAKASDYFIAQQYDLLQKTKKIAAELRSSDLQDSSLKLFNILQNYPNLWGAMLTKNGRPVVWRGYSLGLLPLESKKADTLKNIEIEKQNNVIFWQAHLTFKQQADQKEANVYRLYTTKRIAQSNALKVARSSEYNFLKNAHNLNKYPLAVSLLEPAPDDLLTYKSLLNLSGDSVGVVYAVPGHFEQLLQTWEKANKGWLSVFAIFCFAAFLIFVTFWIDLEILWKNLLLRIFFVLCGWAVFTYISIPTNWLPRLLDGMPAEMLQSYQHLCTFGISALFLFLLAATIHRTLQNEGSKHFKFGPTTAIYGGLIIGIISSLIIFSALNRASTLVLGTSFPLFNLQIIPSPGIILLYIALGLMLWGVALLILNINHFIFRNCRFYYKQSWLISLAGLVFTFALINFIRGDSFLSWKFYITLFFYVL
ncbi:MAG TPA: hypothetical protein VK106_04820, partial [Balneolaceae bacterium]|nr:hypothetical protein [Balneolaceae bacterium]